jgi:hypothetical protein
MDDESRRMGREAVGGERKPATDLSLLADFPARPGPPLTRSSAQSATRSGIPEPGESCVMCGHSGRAHAIGTDGAGWCAGEERCDCNGFQA